MTAWVWLAGLLVAGAGAYLAGWPAWRRCVPIGCSPSPTRAGPCWRLRPGAATPWWSPCPPRLTHPTEQVDAAGGPVGAAGAATPLTAEEKRDLIPAHIAYRRELNAAEPENIARALAWLQRRRRRDLLDERFIREERVHTSGAARRGTRSRRRRMPSAKTRCGRRAGTRNRARSRSTPRRRVPPRACAADGRRGRRRAACRFPARTPTHR